MAAINIEILKRRLAQAVATNDAAGMGTRVCWGFARVDMQRHRSNVMVFLGKTPNSREVLHCITVTRTGQIAADTMAMANPKLSGSFGSYVYSAPGRYMGDTVYHQIGSMTWPQLEAAALAWTGGASHIPGSKGASVTSISTRRLVDSIVASPNAIQKSDLTIMLEYIVENLINNPVTQDALEADEYHKPITRFAGFDIRVENPRGTYRSGVDQQGTPWKNLMYNTYGEFMSTVSVDDDPVDVFLGDHQDCKEVFIVHQARKDEWDKYDEDKVMLGFRTMEEALTAYLRHYQGDKRYIMQVTVMDRSVFKAKLLNCHSGNVTNFKAS